MISRIYRDTAIILRARPLREADRILTLYTKEHGKVDAVAKGVRKPKSHLAGRVEIATEIQAEFHRGRSLDVLTQATVIHAFWQHLLEPATFAAMTTVLDIIDTCCKPEDAHPELYRLVRGMLSALGRFADPIGLLPRFELRLLVLLGVGPECEHCVGCGQRFVDQIAWLHLINGGLICEACHSKLPGSAFLLQAQEVALFVALGRASDDTRRIALRSTPHVTAAIHACLLHYLDRRPRSESATALLL